MEGKIISLAKNGNYKTLQLYEDVLYISNSIHSNEEDLKDYIEKHKNSNYAHTVELDSIKKISVKQKDKQLIIEDSSIRLFKLDFKDENKAIKFCTFLGEKLKFKKTIEKRKFLSNNVLMELFYGIVALAIGIYFAFIASYEEIANTRGRRTGLFKIIYLFIINAVGFWGMFGISAAIFLIFVYRAYKAYAKDGTTIIYSKT